MTDVPGKGLIEVEWDLLPKPEPTIFVYYTLQNIEIQIFLN